MKGDSWLVMVQVKNIQRMEIYAFFSRFFFFYLAIKVRVKMTCCFLFFSFFFLWFETAFWGCHFVSNHMSLEELRMCFLLSCDYLLHWYAKDIVCCDMLILGRIVWVRQGYLFLVYNHQIRRETQAWFLQIRNILRVCLVQQWVENNCLNPR